MKFRKNKNPVRQPRIDSLQNKRQASVNSYYRSPRTRIDANSTSDTSKSQTTQKRSSLSSVINISIILVLAVLLFFASTMERSVIVQLPDDAYTYRPVTEYEAAASTQLGATLTNQSKILFRSQPYEESVLSQFPELRQADAIIPLGGRNLTLVLRIAPPLAYIFNGTERGVLDESGILASKNSVDSEELLTIRFAERQDEFAVGSRMLTTNEVAMVRLLQTELAATPLLGKPSIGIREINFSVRDGQIEVSFKDLPFYAKLSTYADGAEQVGSLKATLLQLEREGSLPSTYIDVRVAGRVFVL